MRTAPALREEMTLAVALWLLPKSLRALVVDAADDQSFETIEHGDLTDLLDAVALFQIVKAGVFVLGGVGALYLADRVSAPHWLGAPVVACMLYWPVFTLLLGSARLWIRSRRIGKALFRSSPIASAVVAVAFGVLAW